MKRFIIKSTVSLALTISAASAMQLEDLIGTWRGKRTETRDGVGHSANVTWVGTRRPDDGLALVGKGKFPIWGMVTMKIIFHKNGKCSSITIADPGFVLSSGSGTWKKSDGDILISEKGGSVSGAKEAHGRFRLLDKNHFRYTGTSGDSRVKFSGTRLW
jgi:hypothetical protein